MSAKPSTKNKGALAATVALVNSMLAGGDCARAQDQQAAPAPTPTPGQLPEVVVTGEESEGYGAGSLSLPKFTDSLLTTPKSATVVTSQLMRDQDVTTLRDALRNVSGISIGAGEGSYQGDNLSIRGFPARSDIFLDGMIDFGNYNRDPFNIEEVEVLKGPSSVEFGRGSSGGVVNEESKMPKLGGFTAGSATFGTDNTERGTLDFDQPIPGLPHAAFRLNLMAQNSQVTGRDDTRYDRWGAAPSLAFGIGTPTRLTINFFHQSEDNLPDYGIPWLFDRPAPVNRNNFYGFSNDFMKTDVNIGTIRLEHDFNDVFTLREQFRAAAYGKDFRITEAQAPDDITPTTPLSSIQVERNIIDGAGTDRLIDQDMSLLSIFETGPIKHSLVTGFEYVHESDFTTRVEPGWENVPNTSLLNPTNPVFPGFGPISTATNVNVDILSAYLIETMKLGKAWTLIGGLRLDHVSSIYHESISPAETLTENDFLFSWRAALVYQPLPNGSIYLSSGVSVHPNIVQLSLSSETTLPASVANAAIGRNLEVELGTKWDLFEKRFSLASAVFLDDETNAAPVDLDDPLFFGVERVIGVEFSAIGRLTDKWQLLLDYTWQYGKILSSSVPGMAGNPVLNCPEDTLSFWTTYDLPWRIQVGAGSNWLTTRTASYVADPANGLLMEAPGYVVFSAMVKYHVTKNIDIQANLENLTNQYYYDGIHPGHIVPGEGRTLFISTNFKF